MYMGVVLKVLVRKGPWDHWEDTSFKGVPNEQGTHLMGRFILGTGK